MSRHRFEGKAFFEQRQIVFDQERQLYFLELQSKETAKTIQLADGNVE